MLSTSTATVNTTEPIVSTSFTIPCSEDRVDGSSAAETASKSLQEAFRKYREDKLKGMRLNEAAAARYTSRKGYRSDPERMWKLRMKFVQQARKYLGVPYAKKNFSPGTPEYESDLFLDCCGLVRRCMRDLEDDFGFRIGNGNQAYMFDTLPKTIERIEDVKPGDLVFISAIYYSPTMKKQPHNMTHVEILLGEGERTIGARWNNGVVQEFDSYNFVSKSYHSMQFYFKSIDPWLLGYCRSYCEKHPWRYNTSIGLRKSIFSLNGQTRKKKKSRSKSIDGEGSRKTKKKKKKKRKSRKRSKNQLGQIDETKPPGEEQDENDLVIVSARGQLEYNEAAASYSSSTDQEDDEYESGEEEGEAAEATVAQTDTLSTQTTTTTTSSSDKLSRLRFNDDYALTLNQHRRMSIGNDQVHSARVRPFTSVIQKRLELLNL